MTGRSAAPVPLLSVHLAGALLAGAVLAGALTPGPVQGQAAATLPALDPAYHDLERLEAFGLVPRGLSGIAPYSRGRVAWIVAEARSRLEAERDDLHPAAAADIEALLSRLEARFAGGSAAAHVEVEAGGGSSPGFEVPLNQLQGLDAVLNPLWSGRGGRAYPDKMGLAAAARFEVGLWHALALSAGARQSGGTYSGVEARRAGTTLEGLYARLAIRRLAFQVGRDWAWTGYGGGDGILLGTNGPPLGLVRVNTERPLVLPVLGHLDFSLFAATLGPGDHYPHAKLFGTLISSRPTPTTEVALTLLNRQMGEGAPPATAAQRVVDLLWISVLLKGDDLQFSSRGAELSVSHRFRAARVTLDVAFEDFDWRRKVHTFRDAAAYRLAIALPTLGSSGRHEARLEVLETGALLYRHHQYRSGATVDGILQGSVPGPNTRGIRLRYGATLPGGAWRVHAGAEGDRRDAGLWFPPAGPEDQRPRDPDTPREYRIRGRGGMIWGHPEGRGGVEVSAGVERVLNLGHLAGATAWNRAALLRVWWGF